MLPELPGDAIPGDPAHVAFGADGYALIGAYVVAVRGWMDAAEACLAARAKP